MKKNESDSLSHESGGFPGSFLHRWREIITCAIKGLLPVVHVCAYAMRMYATCTCTAVCDAAMMIAPLHSIHSILSFEPMIQPLDSAHSMIRLIRCRFVMHLTDLVDLHNWKWQM